MNIKILNGYCQKSKFNGKKGNLMNDQKKISFDEDYYKTTILKHGYNPIDFSPLDFEFHSIPSKVMSNKWLCHSGIDYISTVDETIITTGVGMSGAPHMGTLSQILRIIFLQKSGFKVQMVLGDLDAYNARNKSIEEVSALSKKYYDFIVKLGFDVNKGVLRTQHECLEILHTSYLASKYVSDQDFLDTEEDLSELYIEKKIYAGITFPVKQAILLMVSDFIHLGTKDGYKNVIVMLGLEEHQYVLLARKVIDAMKLPISIYGLYSKIIKGLNGYPKMSKSIRESTISVDMPAETIRSLILEQPDDFNNPSDSVVFQLMSSVSFYDSEELTKLYQYCEEKGNEWFRAKKDYAEMLVEICQLWR